MKKMKLQYFAKPTVKYNGATVATIDSGEVATLPIQGKKMTTDITVTVPSEYIVPSGTVSISSNGTHDVTEYASAEVNVPIPEGYIIPEGTKQITENGTHDVAEFEAVTVSVPGEVLEEYDGAVNIEAAATITFWIESNECTATEGMTWGEWCESHDTYTVDNQGRIFYDPDGTYVADAGEILVLSTDTITADGEYVYTTLVVEDALAGTWVFNDTLTIADGFCPSFVVNFTSGSSNYKEIAIYDWDYHNREELAYRNTSGTWNTAYLDGTWNYSGYKTITITSKLSEVSSGDVLLTWLQANATKQ